MAKIDLLQAHRGMLLGLLSGVAVVLTVVGIYGILAYTVIERRRELGVRMALGAAPQQVLRLMLRDGLRVSAAGIVAGAVLSLAVGPLVSALLFGVSARDPATLVGVPMLVTLISLAACYIPARRAARIDPVIALRED
jgi:ABC-type antimicrobial peptide transport system permease subunit